VNNFPSKLAYSVLTVWLKNYPLHLTYAHYIVKLRNITALGVVLSDKLTTADHVSSILTSCSSSLYALRVPRDHGLQTSSLHGVFRATILAKIRYCAPAWSGLCSASDRAIDSTHSHDAARNRATVLTMFRRRPPNSLLQVISHCSSEFSATNITSAAVVAR